MRKLRQGSGILPATQAIHVTSKERNPQLHLHAVHQECVVGILCLANHATKNHHPELQFPIHHYPGSSRLQRAFNVLSCPSQCSKSLPEMTKSVTSFEAKLSPRPRQALCFFFPVMPGQQQIPLQKLAA